MPEYIDLDVATGTICSLAKICKAVKALNCIVILGGGYNCNLASAV